MEDKPLISTESKIKIGLDDSLVWGGVFIFLGVLIIVLLRFFLSKR